MMGFAKHVGAAAVVVMATVVAVPIPTVSPEVKLSADSTALLVCGTTCPTLHDADVEVIMNQFITPTHPGQTITPVAVTTPGEAWPITGLFRLLGFAVGDPGFFGPGGAAWPDEPWWKLSGLFDLTTDQSIQAGVADLEAAMAAHEPNFAITRIPSTREPADEDNPEFMKRLIVGVATTVLVFGGWGPAASTAQAQPGLVPLYPAPIPTDNGDWGPPHHWCPGQQPVPTTGNHVTDPLNWDWNVCHTYYFVWPGMGNVSNLIWDGDDPPPKPPPAPALNFCPIPPWCP